MGRTVPTFTNIIDQELESWSKYRRGLRIEDQEVFDELFRAARLHLAENFYAMRTVPFESVLISIVLEQGKRLRKIEQLLENCEIRNSKSETSTKHEEDATSPRQPLLGL
jgi:hypothetical protein